ncbi:LacI family DNA-binding transcriptional regulator [uncultured Nocardioides sp.]|uniref:LacI family DNA-binding transcriptional regulator n=1 Tax=uncultured Nocardioides sp. TaxID=198441 RepID=UPI0025DDE333|nr:LacI family DNA-binding transcriptional regulator [uncultured Nocardioides sp.]
MAASVRDVAALAGVSPRTVANVVTGYVHVRPETRARVQRAIDELKYRPNISARSLRSGRSGIIALAVPDVAAPYFAELADHVQREAASRGLTLLVDQTGADRERELDALEGFQAHLIDGLILSPLGVTGEDLQGHDLSMPTVLLGERIEKVGVVHVAVDNVASAREATAHLLDRGRTRVAAVGTQTGAGDMGPAQRRLEGYRAAMRDAGLPATPGLEVPTGPWSREAGYTAVRSLLQRGVDVDGLFCFNDALALAAVRAVVDHGLRVPQDLAVVGWDDIEEAAYAVPSLTTISPDKAAIARAAVDALLGQLDGGSPESDEVLCSYRLVVRESSGAR